MATVSYDNGLYTPDSWDSLATAVDESSTEDSVETSTSAWAADATSMTDEEEEVTSTTSSSTTVRSTSSSSSSAAPASTADATPPPSTYTTSQAAVVSPSSSSPSSTSSSLASSTSGSSSSSAALASASLNALSAADTSSSTSSFVSMKQWLIPVIVVAPILIGILVLGCLYGKCWGRRRQRAQEQEMGSDGGWFGGVGSLGHRRRDHGDEEGGLVEGKYAEDDAECDDFDEKAAYAGTGPPPQRTWSTMLRAGLGRGLSHSSSVRPPRRQKVPFVAVSRPSMDEPFLPPSQSQSHYDQAFRAVPNSRPAQSGGWNYGGRPQPTMSHPTNAGLTSGWGVGNYRARSTSSRNSSVKSRLSARLFGNRNMEEPPSPSCYSHADGAYAGLEGEEDDPEMKEEELNEILAESRTGDSHLARRYMGGETHLAHVRPSPSRQPSAQEEEQYARDRYFARHPVVPPSHHRDPSYDHLVEQMGIDLPTPPSQSHVSPTKTSTGSALLRPAMSGTPPPAKLLFSYDSPPVHSTFQAPSYHPQLVSPERAPGSPRGPLPGPPQPQQPLFGNAPPPRPQEIQFDNSRPLYPAAQPGIFFSTTTQPPIGGPMPPLRQSLAQSSSNYSLSGVRDLIFGAGGEQSEMSGQQQQQQQQQQQGAPKQRPISPTKEGSAKLKKANPNAPQYPALTADRPAVPPRNPSREWDRAEMASFASADPQPSAQEQQSFNPVFPDSAPLPPLQHPSRVRNAIHNLEAASAGSPPPSPTKPSGATTSPYRPMSASYSSSSALAHSQSTSTPSPQRVIRSRTTYQRPMKGASASDDEGEDRISSDKLQRSRTSDSMAARPLSSDPRRLSQMLRRPSAGGGLARPVMLDSEE